MIRKTILSLLLIAFGVSFISGCAVTRRKEINIIKDKDFEKGFNIIDQETTRIKNTWLYGTATDCDWEQCGWHNFLSYTDRSRYRNIYEDNISEDKYTLSDGV